MSEVHLYPVPESFQRTTLMTREKYDLWYKESIEHPEKFWAARATEFLTFFKPWTTVVSADFHKAEARWFAGAELNVSYNCLDRHLEKRADQVAIIWEGDEPGDDAKITYRQLHEKVCRLANVLKARGVKKGDRVCIYMPMVPEAAVAMLACTRIGAIHSVVFGGFSPESLKDRILDADCRVVITADEGLRGGKKVPLKANTDAALLQCPDVHTVIVLKRTGGNIACSATDARMDTITTAISISISVKPRARSMATYFVNCRVTGFGSAVATMRPVGSVSDIASSRMIELPC